MEELNKIIVGIVLFVITSVTAYLFRMRQLYVTSPKLYRHASISDDGSMCEVLIFNRGNQVEEDIRVDLPPELKCELLASSTTGVSLANSTLQIERLHKLKSVSVMLLVENGVLDISKMSIASKNVAGRVVKNQESIPVNYAGAFVGFVLFVCSIVAILTFPNVLEYGRESYARYQLGGLNKIGWTGLGGYSTSNIRKSYSDQEFPLRFESQRISGEALYASFSVYNKTALPLKIYADRAAKGNSSSAAVDIENFSSLEVAPMSSGKLQVKMPYSREKDTVAEFSINMGPRERVTVLYKFDAK